MKVTHDSPQMLVIEDVPWLLATALSAAALLPVGIGLAMLMRGEWTGLLVGTGGFAFGALFLAVFVRRTRLILDLAQGMAELKRRSVLGTKVWTWTLAEIEGARIEESSSDGSTTCRPVLMLRGGGREPVTPVYTSGRAPARMVEAINSWLGAAEGRRRG